MRFHKYHALGNDYIVLDPADSPRLLSEEGIRLLCHRNYGVGSDGILRGPLLPGGGEFMRLCHAAGIAVTDDILCGLRIFNPDGSEAEKSGNGLRIFCRHLYDSGRVGVDRDFVLATLGGTVRCRILESGQRVRVEMGRVSFDSSVIPVTGESREVINEEVTVGGTRFRFCAATVGNPHCVILQDQISADEACRFGPLLETAPIFPNRTNVQFMKVIDRANLAIEIWERGAGYTLASGSSASACAAVAYRLGLCDRCVTVHMQGGDLNIDIAADFAITMQGPVTAVAHGDLADDMAAALKTMMGPDPSRE